VTASSGALRLPSEGVLTASLRGGSVLRPYEALAWDNRDGGGVLLMVDQQL
jgi:hypothetical protein